MFFDSLAEWEKEHLIEGISFELNQCETKAVRKAVKANLLVNIHPDLAAGVAERIRTATACGLLSLEKE